MLDYDFLVDVHLNLSLEIALQTRKFAVKGILVSLDMFDSLYASGRLVLKRGSPDIGIEFWVLGERIFVTVNPFQ